MSDAVNESTMLAAHPPWRPWQGLIVALMAAVALVAVALFQ